MIFTAVLVVCGSTDISSCQTLMFPEAFSSSEACEVKLAEGLDIFTSQGLYVSAACKQIFLPGESA